MKIEELEKQFGDFSANLRNFGIANKSTKEYEESKLLCHGLLYGVRHYLEWLKKPPGSSMGMVERAKEFATKCHEGQKRWNGEPFITHPAAVAANVPNNPVYQQVAWLHDVMEDCDIVALDLMTAGFEQLVVNSVVALTRGKKESYVDYMLRIKSSDTIVHVVKRQDLIHNMSTCPKEHSASMAKWQLALHILENSYD